MCTALLCIEGLCSCPSRILRESLYRRGGLFYLLTPVTGFHYLWVFERWVGASWHRTWGGTSWLTSWWTGSKERHAHTGRLPSSVPFRPPVCDDLFLFRVGLPSSITFQSALVTPTQTHPEMCFPKLPGITQPIQVNIQDLPWLYRFSCLAPTPELSCLICLFQSVWACLCFWDRDTCSTDESRT